MKKKLPWLITAAVAILLLILGVIHSFSTKTKFNETAVNGNTAGNLYNRGLLCEYDGVVYRRVERKQDLDVIQQGNMRITSIEQTVVDSIRDFEKIAGLEEVIRCMMLVPGLNEQKVLECLARNNNGFLYQKCGYLFEEMQEEFHFSVNFFEACENGSSDAKRYLMKESQDNVFHKRWKLYAPASLKGLIDKGVDDYDAMG